MPGATNFFRRNLLTCLFICFEQISLAQTTQSALKIDLEKAPVVAWTFKTKGPVFASPMVQQNIAYVGSLDSTLYALDIATGQTRWTQKFNGAIRSTVCLDADRLYFVCADGLFYAVNINTGKVLWRFRTLGGILGERKYDFADYYHSSPLILNNRLFFGSGDGRVYALKAETGEVIWSFQTNDIVHNTPVVYGDKLYIGSFDGNLYALNIQSGTLAWKFKSVGHRYFPKGEMQGSPVVANGLVYIGSRDYNLYAVDAQHGYAHWNKQFPMGWSTALTPRDTILYVGTSDDRVMVALDGRNGRELWRTNTKFNIFGGCSFTTGMGYFGTLQGKIFGLDLKTGTIRWTFTTDGYQQYHDRYFKADDSFRDDIGALIRVPEDFLAMYYRMGAIFSKPAISGNRILISSLDGTVYCLRSDS